MILCVLLIAIAFCFGGFVATVWALWLVTSDPESTEHS